MRESFSGNSLEFAKLAAIVLMTVNHVTDALPDPWLHLGYFVSRPCIPLFCSIVVVRLADGPAGRLTRAIRRLLIWGAIAQPIYTAQSVAIALRLDVLFTLAAGLALIWLLRRGRYGTCAAACLALVFADRFFDGGALTPLAMMLGFLLMRRSVWAAIALMTLAAAVADFISVPGFALGALGVIFAPFLIGLSMRLRDTTPRLPMQAFYAYYPAHLLAIYVIFGPYP